jgi:hypothetical protein
MAYTKPQLATESQSHPYRNGCLPPQKWLADWFRPH